MSALSLALAALAPSGTGAPAPFTERKLEVAQGRSLFLRCAGEGPVTVLFDSGGSDWSIVWTALQQRIAGRARACAYDRAGLGRSDPAPGPRTPFAIASDLHAMIDGAGFRQPVVLVGHSLGGFHVKLAAALFPQDVAGLVLLDPSEERSWERTRGPLGAKHGVANAARAELADRSFFPALVEKYRGCAERAKAAGGLDPAAPDWRRCADPDRPALGDEANAERRRIHSTPTYQAAQYSEIAWCVYADPSADGVYARLFRPGMLGNKPVAVLTHQEEQSDDPVDRVNAEQGLLLHRETAALSRRGTHRLVTGSGHYIQLDQPEVAARAILAVVEKVGRQPAPPRN
ncbi:alpha/beta hydrolase [Sphingomonas swuensis]